MYLVLGYLFIAVLCSQISCVHHTSDKFMQLKFNVSHPHHKALSQCRQTPREGAVISSLCVYCRCPCCWSISDTLVNSSVYLKDFDSSVSAVQSFDDIMTTKIKSIVLHAVFFHWMSCRPYPSKNHIHLYLFKPHTTVCASDVPKILQSTLYVFSQTMSSAQCFSKNGQDRCLQKSVVDIVITLNYVFFTSVTHNVSLSFQKLAVAMTSYSKIVVF